MSLVLPNLKDKPEQMKAISSSTWNTEILPNENGFQYRISKTVTPENELVMTSLLSFDSEDEAKAKANEMIQKFNPIPPAG